MIRTPVSLLVFFCLSLAAFARPNFVLIFIDDMGYGDIGPYGSKLNHTPQLDKMAAEGMKLTSFYAAPVCSASRAQLLTGSYAPRVSVPGVFFPRGPKGLNPDELTVADYLKELGYATACVGKWHLGDQREFLPVNNGFDSYFGIPYSNDMARPSEDGRKVHPLVRDDQVAELLENEDQRRITREYTHEAVKFIETNKDKPFFLYLPHTAMHVPIYPHQDFVGKSNNGRYGDWVAEVDWSVGKLLETLRKNGLDKNTLVLFTSDNGPWASKGKDGGVATPLRGAKGGTLEGGVRVPTIAWWPGTIAAKATNDAITGTTDVLPTFVSLAGGTVREEVKIDGHDLSDLLRGKASAIPDRVWHYFQGTRLKAVRQGPWKLAVAGQRLGMGLKNEPDLQKPMRLYNLDDETGEVTDVAKANPQVVARLQALADEISADLKANTRPVGQVANPVMLYASPAQSRSKFAKPAAEPINWKVVKKGDSFAAAAAPGIAGRSFKVEAEIVGEGDGVILAHGGSAVGYSLYRKDGKVFFALRSDSDSLDRISVEAPSKAKVLATAHKSGRLTLTVNGLPTVRGKAGTIGRHPQETLDVGHDSKNPVDPDASTAFGGQINEVRVEVE